MVEAMLRDMHSSLLAATHHAHWPLPSSSFSLLQSLSLPSFRVFRSSDQFRLISEAQVSPPAAQAWVYMKLLLKVPYFSASWVVTATSAPTPGGLVFGFRMPLGLSDGRCGSLESLPSGHLPFSLDGTRPQALSFQHYYYRHLCV